jgi:hypothetical protein
MEKKESYSELRAVGKQLDQMTERAEKLVIYLL